MVATYTPNLRLTLQGDNDNPNTWGDVENEQVITLIEEALGGVVTIDCTGSSDVDISATVENGATDDARHAVLELTGTLGANIQLIIPALEKVYLIRTEYTGAYTITVIPAGAGSGITFSSDQSSVIYTNGTDIYNIGIIGGIGGSLLAANNLSDLLNVVTARTNLGLAIGTNVQAYDPTLSAVAAFNTNGIFTQVAADTFTGRTITGSGIISVTNGDGIAGNPTISADVSYIPQTSQSTDYEFVLADKGTCIIHPSSDVTARTFTIPSNASVPYVIGTVITVANLHGAGAITLDIDTDSLYLAGSGSTGPRTLAPNGICTIMKTLSTEWLVSGTGLT